MWIKKNNDDDGCGTVIDRKLIIFNNINTNSRFNNGATDADTTAAIAIILPFTVAVLRAFELFERSFYFMIDRAKKLKQAKLGQFSMYWTETGQGFHKNFTFNMIRPFDCTVRPSDSLKKERLCLKIVLGQTWFEFH